ncbi:NAD(P)H-dependent oxidoreductase [Priestia endophytica]|jgi:NADPH dehydrogenase (quinone)|uniref:Modulator of drug activity B n=1 Tax=Priestia endophytica DSM 13796 TaxID=1121089 RepID=A0A1I5YT83_9BACI|nr:NAD(P)H-dependent oxidoreductase [Priestia endophytica]KYG28046.1 flavodoxin [Priestia endophytica]MBG9813942.1 flavodoxin [Priestia endophytica]SFQ47488.1 modulator of drug activity B [Priestia endophytica DSM 13796]
MKKILLINGHEPFKKAQGKLNQNFFKHMEVVLKNFEIEKTVVTEGYCVEKEIEKFKWMDAVIVQTPIYWFSVPGLFKTYIDTVFLEGAFFEKAKKFGHGGLLTGKQYLFSTTWGANEAVFNRKSSFLEGKSVDDVLFPLHKTFQYCGMDALPSFSVFNAMRNQHIQNTLEDLSIHLNHHINQSKEKSTFTKELAQIAKGMLPYH